MYYRKKAMLMEQDIKRKLVPEFFPFSTPQSCVFLPPKHCPREREGIVRGSPQYSTEWLGGRGPFKCSTCGVGIWGSRVGVWGCCTDKATLHTGSSTGVTLHSAVLGYCRAWFKALDITAYDLRAG